VHECVAVGDAASPLTMRVAPLAERWNGRTWSILPRPKDPASQAASVLSAVSCATPGVCEAVGSGALAESWNGTSWAIQPTPTPGGALSDELDAVSCSAALVCTAVGDYVAGNEVQSPTLTLAMTFS
jgi:hypothetical protein